MTDLNNRAELGDTVTLHIWNWTYTTKTFICLNSLLNDT